MSKLKKLNQESPLKWVLNLSRLIKSQKDELTRRKLAALERAAYDYYLTVYISDMLVNERLDFHPELYLSRRIICPFAQKMAVFEIEKISKRGAKRINELFDVLLSNIKKERQSYE